MGENTKIEWADHTFNPWYGCQRVGPGCDNCYAESWAKRSGLVQWGPGSERRRSSTTNWRGPVLWNTRAARMGVRYRVFCASLADVFDNAVPQIWRNDLWRLIRNTPNLDWLIVTKRIGNATKMLPSDWESGYANVWLLITVVNQEEAERSIARLLTVPARIRGLSIEPLLGPIHILNYNAIDWVIVGGESGPNARPMNPQWVRNIRNQCCASQVPFYFKQWGSFLPSEDGMVRVGKQTSGRILDGRIWDEYPNSFPFATSQR